MNKSTGRCLYTSIFAEFLNQEPLAVLGALHNNYHGDSLTTPEEALKREIWEELETRIVVERLVQTVEWDYPAFGLRPSSDATRQNSSELGSALTAPSFHLTMHCYLCHVESGHLELKEHEARGEKSQLCNPAKWCGLSNNRTKFIRFKNKFVSLRS